MAAAWRWLDRVCDALAAAAAAMLVAIAFGIVLQASARALGLPGFSHVFALTEFGLFYIAMLAAPWLAARRGHVFIEILSSALPERARPSLDRAVAVLCAVICLVFVRYSGEAALAAWARGDVDMRSFDMPRWLLLGAMPPCFALMAAQFLRSAFARGGARA